MVAISIMLSPLGPVFCLFMDNSHLFPYLRPTLEPEVDFLFAALPELASYTDMREEERINMTPFEESHLLEVTHLANLHADSVLTDAVAAELLGAPFTVIVSGRTLGAVCLR